MSRKNAVRFGAGAAAAICLIAEKRWAGLASPIQMGLYTVMTMGLVLVGFWSDRRRPRFTVAICSMLGAHCLVLYAIRGMFPFRTILTVCPLAIIEGIALAALLLKIVEYSETGGDI
jgi:hypothetical protein